MMDGRWTDRKEAGAGGGFGGLKGRDASPGSALCAPRRARGREARGEP